MLGPEEDTDGRVTVVNEGWYGLRNRLMANAEQMVGDVKDACIQSE